MNWIKHCWRCRPWGKIEKDRLTRLERQRGNEYRAEQQGLTLDGYRVKCGEYDHAIFSGKKWSWLVGCDCILCVKHRQKTSHEILERWVKQRNERVGERL